MKKEIKYVIPSYNRADGVTTLDYVSKGKMYVSQQDYPNYIKHNARHKDKIVELPDGVQGKGKAHVQNWILENLWDDNTEAIIFLDDDITCLMGKVRNGKDYEIDESLFYELVEDFVLLAQEWGCAMFSFGINSDPMSYDEFKPFRCHSYLDGTLQGFVKKDTLRFDEELTVKEDVDMFLQQIQKYHKALRIDKYYFKVKSFQGTGGSQAFRSVESEKKQFVMMQKKWGADIIRPNKPTAKKASTIRSFGGAIKLNLPLKGV